MPLPFDPPPQTRAPPPPRPQNRRQRTRYYAHRVRESLSSRITMIACSIFLTLLLIAGVVVFVLWLSLRPHRPRFHVVSFSVPGLTQSSGYENSEISFNVSARNPNRNIGIFYVDQMAASLFYRDSPVAAATPLLPPFYQPPKNTTTVLGVFGGSALNVRAAGWAQFKSDVAGGKVWFRLELTVTIRFRLSTWDTHDHGMHVGCDVGVGPDGSILAESRNTRCTLYFGR